MAEQRRNRFEWRLGACLIVCACATTPVGAPAPSPAPSTRRAIDDHQLSSPDLSASKKLTLWATYYSIPRVVAVESGGHALLDREGRELGPSLSTRDFCDAAMEGTVQIRSRGRWRTYNYAGTGPSAQVDCSDRYPHNQAIGRSRFRVSSQPFGEGAIGARLIPFRTIAVDPRFIPHGTVLFIPAARGTAIELDGGEKRTHDGYFFAADTGGAIKGPHIDIFIGVRKKNPFEFIGSSKRNTFEAYVIEGEALRLLFDEVHALHASRDRG